MEYFYQLDQIQLSHQRWVGDKALYLSMCQQRGYPIAPGMVVSAAAFCEFLETIRWVEPWFADLPNSSLHVDVNNPRQLQAIAQQIHQGIEATPIPSAWLDKIATTAKGWQAKFLRLQPSIAFEPVIDSNTNWRTATLLQEQVCGVEQGTIAQGLRQVWSELFRAKSLLYWQRLGIQLQQVHFAVLIQPIKSAIASGNVQIDAAHLEVQSIWGIGDALIEGIVTADVYEMNRETGLLQTATLATKRYAYDLDSAVPIAVVQGAALPLPLSPSGLRLYSVASDQQRHSSLSDRQLQRLVQIAQQLAQEWEQPLGLEWVLGQSPSSETGSGLALEPTLYLTQLCLGSVQFAASAAPASAIGVSIKPVESLSDAILTGLAAAGGQVIAQAWVVDDLRNLSHAPARSVLITSHIQPHWVAALGSFVAIVTEQGGVTSHGAILAREIGIPAVVGVVGAMQQIQSGDVVFVDGDRGWVGRVREEDVDLHDRLIHTTAIQERAAKDETANADTANTEVAKEVAKAKAMSIEAIEPKMAHSSTSVSSSSVRAIATQLMVNLSQTSSLAQVATMPIDGVGLLRSELMLQEILKAHSQSRRSSQAGTELIELLAHQIRQFGAAFAPRPVFYRSLDLRSHEASLGDPSTVETNPTLGLHGTFSYQIDPFLFDLELAALRRLQREGNDNIHLILPFVRTVEEFEFCRDRVVRAGLTQTPHFQLWIMAEVPSVLFLIPDYVKAGVQGISIGSNDLTQLLLAVDRDHPHMNAAFDQRHPAVLRAIQHLIQSARQAGIPCSICGQIPAQYPDVVELLIKWGITSISVSPDAVEKTYTAIANAEWKLLLDP